MIGKDQWHPGFNGQYRNVLLRIHKNAFIDTPEDFQDHINRFPRPTTDWDRIVAFNQAGAAFTSVAGQGTEEYKVIGGGDNAFP